MASSRPSRSTKSASPSTLPKPGGVFTFTLTSHNTSVEPVEITDLTDTNALSAECLALIGTSSPRTTTPPAGPTR